LSSWAGSFTCGQLWTPLSSPHRARSQRILRACILTTLGWQAAPPAQAGPSAAARLRARAQLLGRSVNRLDD
jgi:hypothetical protein